MGVCKGLIIDAPTDRPPPLRKVKQENRPSIQTARRLDRRDRQAGREAATAAVEPLGHVRGASVNCIS